MAIDFQSLLTDALMALGDSTGVTWSRINRMWPWAIEAMRTFPNLRPMHDDQTIVAGETHGYDMPVDFREVISIEFPISQSPPVYLIQKNRLDPEFYNQDYFYDIDHDYESGNGWVLYFSGTFTVGAHVHMQYFANHDLDMEDDDAHFITIPDEYEGILLASIMCRAYRERLGFMMQNPTATTNVIMQYTTMVRNMEESYNQQVAAAQSRLASSKITTHQHIDKYDRVY